MITAKEARKLAETQVSDRTEKELEDAERYIEQAIHEGETECRCYRYLGKQAKEYLESLGYSVKNEFNQRDGNQFLIKW